MSKKLIPYVILEAHPDWKRPCVLPEFGMVQEDRLSDFLLEKLVEFVYDRIDIENLTSVDDIYKFWEHFYTERRYMANSPWEANAIIDGIWNNVNPSNEVLFNALIKEKNKCYISSDDENEESVKSSETVKTSETVESIIIEDNETEISYDLAMKILFNR